MAPLPIMVAGRPSATGLTFWTLAADQQPPRVTLAPAAPGQRIVVHSLRRPGDELGQSGIHLVGCTGLAPDTLYRLEAVSADGASGVCMSRTLPDSLAADRPFTIALGSCYCRPTDAAGIARFYPPPAHGPVGDDPVRLRFLLGDQVYMDLGDSANRSLPTLRAPDVAARYVEQWSHDRVAAWLSAGPTVCLADDHEMWNDYPHQKPWLLWSEDGSRGPLARRLVRAFHTFQSALNLAPERVVDDAALMDARLVDESLSFRIDVGPLSFAALDTRVNRTLHKDARRRFADPRHLDAVVRWLGEDGGPAVLALGPTFVAGTSLFGRAIDKGLVDYEEQYRLLGNAILDARRPVLILAGDIHLSRLHAISPLPRFGRATVYELTSSALSRIAPPARFLAGTFEPDIPPDRTGKLTHVAGYWENALVDGSPTARFVTIERQTYATVSFTRAGAAIRAVARAWVPQSGAGAPRQLLQRTLTLTSAP